MEKTETQKLREERGEDFDTAFAWSIKEWLTTHMIDGVKMESLEEELVLYLAKVFKIAPLVCFELVKNMINERIFQTLTKIHSSFCASGVGDSFMMPHELPTFSSRESRGLDWLDS